jgi:mRNA-degrading endonuclease RelE of RelBE toxin-antitoxin system
MGLQIRINKTFLKELSKMPASQRAKVEQFVFKDASTFSQLGDVPNLKKLKGYKN